MTHKLVTACICSFTCLAQAPTSNPGQEQLRQILNQMQSLQISLTTDHTEILPGERLCFTAEVRNPSGAAIRALAPFHPRSGKITFLVPTTEEEGKQGLGDWKSGSPDRDAWGEDPGSNPMQGRVLERIEANARLTRSICLTNAQSQNGDGLSAPLVHTALLSPNRYKLHWSYGRGAEVEFEVLRSAGFVAWAAAPLREAEQFWQPGVAASKECLGLLAAAVRTATTTFVITSESGAKDICLSPRVPQDLVLLRAMAPFVRVAEVKEGVQSLSLQPIGDGSVQVLWQDGQGYRNQRIQPRPQFPDSARTR